MNLNATLELHCIGTALGVQHEWDTRGRGRNATPGTPAPVQFKSVSDVKDRSDWPEHLQKVYIPPAWKNVSINLDPNAALLVKGVDKKGRPQYLYSKKYSTSQSGIKFARIQELNAKFDKVWNQNEQNRQSGSNKDAADCQALIMKMGLRPGSTTDTKADKQAFGASTLEGKHVVEDNDQLYLRFTGKKGVDINLPVTDKDIASMLRSRADSAGPNGKLFPSIVGNDNLRTYVHTLDGGGFKTKDFRTLLGTRTAADLVASMPVPETEKAYKQQVKAVATTVSAKLGNTPAVALQSYISPFVFSNWKVGQHGTA